MDKKEAEVEAMRKAKDAQQSAGKNVGMSGRDLVSYTPSFSRLTSHCHRQSLLQFQYNPEWFEEEDDGDASDDWDLDKFRREQEEEDQAAEQHRIASLALQERHSEEDTEDGGGGADN